MPSWAAAGVVGLASICCCRARDRSDRSAAVHPEAMIIAQALLVMPILAALTRQTIEDLSPSIATSSPDAGRPPAAS